MYSTIVLQDGPIKEVGVNGDQVDDLIGFCVDRLEGFNAAVRSDETTDAIHFLTRNRQARGVEGTSQP